MGCFPVPVLQVCLSSEHLQSGEIRIMSRNAERPSKHLSRTHRTAAGSKAQQDPFGLEAGQNLRRRLLHGTNPHPAMKTASQIRSLGKALEIMGCLPLVPQQPGGSAAPGPPFGIAGWASSSGRKAGRGKAAWPLGLPDGAEAAFHGTILVSRKVAGLVSSNPSSGAAVGLGGGFPVRLATGSAFSSF